MAAVGLAARFEGSSHDSFDDGRTALNLELTLWDANGSTGWMLDPFAPPRFVPLLGRCVRLVRGTEARVELEIAPARPSGSSVTAASNVPGCASPPPEVAPLEDFSAVQDGHRYLVVVERDPDDGEWRPALRPRMPRHHGCRLDWTNLVDHPELASVPSERLRFTFKLLSHRIQAVPSQRRWRASYRAEVEQICRP